VRFARGNADGSVEFGVVMKSKTKILFLLFGPIFPYMGFVMYRALVHPENPFPKWFLYAAPCYFVGAIALFVVLRKKILASASPLGLAEKNTQRLAAARSVRRMAYIWWVGPVFYFLNGGLGEPVWTTILGLCWVGFLSWVCFREAKKIEAKVLNNVAETTLP
jgi:hypothetical protein